jgi:hypothetical protein
MARIIVEETRAAGAFSAAEALRRAEPRFSRGEALEDTSAGARTH